MPAENLSYLEVAVAAPIEQTLTYTAPIDGIRLAPGQRLLVPLGRRLVTGYLLSFSEKPQAEYKLRKIKDVLDEAPIFPEKMVPFFRWIAGYYHYPIGEVIKIALPAGLTPQSGRTLSITEKGRESWAQATADLQAAHPWLRDLLDKGALGPAAMRKIWGSKERRKIEQWVAQGYLDLEQIVAGESVKKKTETCVSLLQDPDHMPDAPFLKASEQKTISLLREMLLLAPTVARLDLTRIYPGAAKALKSLADKGLIHLSERHVYRDPFGEPPIFSPKPERLTADQQTAMAAINPAIEQKRYTPFLLHGVTGSGKTEIYLRAAETALTEGRGVLILVPEIALASQLEGNFISRFGEQVALLHSGLSKGERFDQWHRILAGQAKIVIGARSAIFAPLADPGLIIVDEEHDGAYKQEDTLRYQARDLALLRGSQTGATVVLGSATPSIASYQHALSHKYTLLSLPQRVENRPMPKVEIVNLQGVPTVSGRPPLFSPQLTRAVRETLAQGQQSLIFLNRRGFAGCMICSDCGQPVQCNHCRISLTVHKGKGELICHYCGYSLTSATVCANCRSTKLVPVGFGTERVEDELRTLFPKARIARLDRDTTSKRGDFIKILRQMHQQEIDILVGTQMIAKGHHFPKVTLVGIVWADAGLGIPDYKSGERTFQLLAQVTGRAGRGDDPGRVIIQTHQPNHYSVVTARQHDYPTMFSREIELRQALGFPPFSRMINLGIDGETESKVKERAIHLAERARILSKPLAGISVLGPAPAPLTKLRSKFRWQLLLKGTNIDLLHSLCRKLAKEHATLSSTVKLTVDVDPENML
ncbi:MAG: primosomal protein N' [Desulfobulbaceae bacterium]|nr:primosomal protein N' [Desulfobulbaceae bacterium]HIJ78483.1 primosomal protein N' [Deltaproteobacteria bacterium]